MNSLSWSDYRTCLNTLIKSELPIHRKAPTTQQITTDTRSPLANKWFLPLKGERHDGHNFIKEALEQKKALGSFCEEAYVERFSPEIQQKLIIVSNTLKCLQQIAEYNREQNKKTIILALTGSVGKTTTKNMLASILRQTNEPFLLAEKNYNNEIGVPLTLLKLKQSHKYAVIEMGARKPNDINFLSNLVKPNITACLNVGSSHLGSFTSKDKIYSTKLEIIKNRTNNQKNIVFRDDSKLLKEAQKIDKSCYTFGTSPLADAQIIKETLEADKMKLEARLFDTNLNLELQISHNAYGKNALAASLMAFLADIPTSDIQKGLLNFISVGPRFKVYKYKSSTIIDDSYNASFESMVSGMETVNLRYPKSEITYILGDMLDLGEYSKDYHQKLGELCLKNKKPHKLITIGEHSKTTTNIAIEKGFKKSQTQHYNCVEDFLKQNNQLSHLGEVIYIKGSFAMNLGKIIKHLKQLERDL